MSYEKNSDVSESHAVFSPSQSSWLRYDREKILDRLRNVDAKRMGTELHEFAKSQIDLHIKVRGNKNVVDSFMTYIYRKYYDETNSRVSTAGERILRSVSRISPETIVTLRSYINDCIGYCMVTEAPLEYDPIYFFGTADAYCYRDDILRVSDLKTGVVRAHMEQLMIYAALFCLSRKIKPSDLKKTELRIYQNAQIIYHEPPAKEIEEISRIIIDGYKIACEYERSFAR